MLEKDLLLGLGIIAVVWTTIAVTALVLFGLTLIGFALFEGSVAAL